MFTRSDCLAFHAALVAALAACGGCAPTFSELQSAKLAGPGRVEVTPSYSAVGLRAEGESEKIQDHYGVQVGTGVTANVDVRVRYEHIGIEDNSVNVFGLGPKIGLARDRLAVNMPIGFAFGDDVDMSETFQFHPTLLLTAPLGDHAEVTGSAKLLVPFDRDIDDTVAFNLGLGLGPDLSSWVIRPETGILVNPGQSGLFWHVSLGFTGYLGERRTPAFD